ncbi:histidine kinase [Polymorphospora sp. NPDC051019]|uniref:sensor histidine kinase n=1 Tax=Polymorphospora sp. NPDC051019 TaxID=3155725 RepID=UPI00341A230A
MDDPIDALRAAPRDLRRLLVGPDYPPYRAEPAGRWRRFRPYLVQAGLLGLIGLTVAAAQYLQDARGLPEPAAIALGIGATLPAGIALRSPLWAWRLGYLMLFLGTLHARQEESWPWNPVQIFGFLFVLVLLAVRADAGVAAWAGLLTLLPVYLLVPTLANAHGVTVLVAVTLVVGDQVRRRRQSQRALVEQAEVSELEKARRAVLEERTRIARELHDVVAHHMSMIAVQAETAPYRLESVPDPARAEFAAIAGSARDALTDMRRLLGVLRSDATDPQTAPQPGLVDVPELVEAARRAGMTVTLEGDPVGTPAPPEAVGLTAYRIVQEALANAARHAPGAAVRVALLPGVGELALRVENGPYSGVTGPAGHGLTGMRERARLLDGSFHAGPVDSGGFLVVARLPYAAGPRPGGIEVEERGRDR